MDSKHVTESTSGQKDIQKTWWKEAIVKTFGEDQRFYTCSAENMDADELIVFLKQKGKFMPIENGFTVDITKVCNH